VNCQRYKGGCYSSYGEILHLALISASINRYGALTETLSTLNQRISDLREFVDAHEKLITKYIVPIATQTNEESSKFNAGVEGAFSQPRISEIEEAGMRITIKSKTKNLLTEIRDSMRELRELETASFVIIDRRIAHMTDKKATEYVDVRQKRLVEYRYCREGISHLGECLEMEVSEDKALAREERQPILKSYLVDTWFSDEGVIGILIMWSRRDPEASRAVG
jgi:hypothetical protein